MTPLGLMGFDNFASPNAWGASGSTIFDRFPLGGARVWKTYAQVHQAIAMARTGKLSPERARSFQNAEAMLARMETKSLSELFMPVQLSSLPALSLRSYL